MSLLLYMSSSAFSSTCSIYTSPKCKAAEADRLYLPCSPSARATFPPSPLNLSSRVYSLYKFLQHCDLTILEVLKTPLGISEQVGHLVWSV